ncbi:MAG: hypothetical protein ACRDSK_11465 [Actinophytocola sp.]|uniref:hypothetical protein n=1 Tax=Actinophytocola sp. TaxID=1872138 RepID=UPI003D6B8F3E
MDVVEVSQALEEMPGVQVAVAAGQVSVYVPAIEDAVHIDPAAVTGCRRIQAPNGDPAVQFVLNDAPLIIAPGDVVFEPVDTGAVLDSTMAYRITNAPELVAYTEMERDAETTARNCERPGPINVDSAAATLLAVRCCIVAAARVGLRPVRSVAWWQRGFTALGGELPLPPFRTDPVWDELTREASSR